MLADSAIRDDTITLAHFELDDAPLLMQIDRDPEAARWFDFPAITLDDASHRARAEDVIRRWGTEARAGLRHPFAIRRGDVAIGTVELRPLDATAASMSYALLASARGHGYASRAVRLLADAAERAGFTHLEIRTDVDNVASQRVAERAGFVRDRIGVGTGRFHHYAPYSGTRRDEIVFVRCAHGAA
jgi:RimJ/RimL family protein N-acetyltransferase